MKEKSKFQKELEHLASRQIALMVLAGSLLFCAAIIGFTSVNQRLQRERHLDAMERTFLEIYSSTETFLKDEENNIYFRNILYYERDADKGKLRYQLSNYNIAAPVGLNLILTDATGREIFTSFSDEEMNLHRREFNSLAVDNAVNQKDELYSTVYYFSGTTSEYVVVHPIYEKRAYLGSVSVYLKDEDWGRHFLKYQYDSILTNEKEDVIFCSNTSFLQSQAGNKYRHKVNTGSYVTSNDSRYLTGFRYLSEPGIYLYSFIYAPRNFTYILIGMLIILSLGAVWTVMLFHLLQTMAAKTSESVGKLVGEIRVIRKKDPDHVVQVETGDEIEEIAEQINKMVASIKELDRKNLELAEINNRMEIRNLQAQLNPHFIYNTLDNIRYLIIQDAAKADELIGRFTRILRYSINNTKQRVMLCEDMEYIQDYLVIQKTRFGHRFQYEIEIEPECQAKMIPKLLLQPLIENSLKYGFKKKNEIFIEIKGWIANNYLLLQVKDDGPGQPKSTLETLRGLLSRKEIHTVHNGLQNIHRQILLEYGHESGIFLESEEENGFTVLLKLWIGEVYV